MNAVAQKLDRFFGIARMGSSVRVEVVAGITTFLAMSYIIAVNPAILSAAGIPPVAAAFATCLVAGLGTIAMGLIARMPLALAPGMGLNAFFAFTVVGSMGLTWQEALGVVFISGCVFVVLTIAGIRQALVRMMPRELLPAIGAGIGLFLLMIGLRNGGIVMESAGTIITRGDWGDPKALLTIATVVVIAALLARGFRAGILVGILVATVVSIPLGLNAEPASDGSWTDGLLALDIGGAIQIGFLDIIFAMLFVDFFDSLGTVIGLIRRAKLEDETGNVPRLGRILAVDGASTIAGALAGTSTVTTYIESAAGISAGGRTGLTAIVVGVLFLLALPLAALVAIVPESAVAAALVIIAATTVGLVREINWDDLDTAVPALVTMAGMPLTFSIADGLAMGLVSYSVLKILRGKGLEVSWLVHVLAVVFIARYIFIA